MLKGFSIVKAVEYMRTCILLETKMNETLNKWKSKMDVSSILEEAPWLDEVTASLSLIEDDLRGVMTLSQDFIRLSKDVMEDTAATPKVQALLYFESPIVSYMKSIMDSGAQISENDFMVWRGRFEKAHLTIRNFINEMFNVAGYSDNEKDPVFESYEAQYGTLSEYFAEIANYCKEHPLFYSKVVDENSELFKQLFNEHTDIDKEEFDRVCESVMPWDVVMFKRGELAFDRAYLTRLERRIEDESSIYNDIPIIVDVLDKLPDERCKDLYKYEFLIGIQSIQYIKEGTVTWGEVLDDCVSQGQTAYF